MNSNSLKAVFTILITLNIFTLDINTGLKVFWTKESKEFNPRQEAKKGESCTINTCIYCLNQSEATVRDKFQRI